MTDTLPNVKLDPNDWTDLYLASGIPAGTQLLVENIGVCAVYLSAQATKPTDESSYQIVGPGEWLENDTTDTGAWAYCQSDGSLLNVRAK